MPIYEFQCRACGTCFEEIMPATSATVPPCPQCGTAEDVHKCLSACARIASDQDGSAAGCASRGGFS